MREKMPADQLVSKIKEHLNGTPCADASFSITRSEDYSDWSVFVTHWKPIRPWLPQVEHVVCQLRELYDPI